MTTTLRDQLRRWFPLALVFLAVGLSASMAYPFLSLFLTTAVHASPWRVSVYLIAGPVAGIGITQYLGRLSDRRPIRRTLLIVAASAGIVAMLANAFVRDYWVLLGVTATLAAIGGSMMSQGFAYARSILAGSERAAMMTSGLRMLFSLAWVGGPPLAALIQSTGGFSALYATAAGMYAAALIVTLALLPEPQPSPLLLDDPADTVEAAEAATGVLPVDESLTAPALGPDAPVRTLAGTIAAFALLQGATAVAVQMLSLYLHADLHAGVGQAGLILGLCAGLEIPLMLMFGMLSTRFPLRRLVLIGPLFSVVYLVLASTATHTWILFAGQLLNAMSIAAIQGLGVSYVQDLLPRDPGKASALYSNSFAAGLILSGPMIAAAETIGYRSAYLLAAGISLLGFTLIAISRPPRPANIAAEQPTAQAIPV
jgi:SET family sugar efflux transporter-like MFS transporter